MKVVSQEDFQHLFSILGKLDAVLLAEAHTPADELENYYFRVNKQRVAVISEEFEPVKIIAPKELVDQIEKELGTLPVSSR